MSIKIDSKILLAFASGLSGGVVLGAVAYKNRKEFRKLMDNNIYPGLNRLHLIEQFSYGVC